VLIVRAAVVAKGATPAATEGAPGTPPDQQQPKTPVPMQGSATARDAPDGDAAPAATGDASGPSGADSSGTPQVTSYRNLADLPVPVADIAERLLAGTPPGTPRSSRTGHPVRLPDGDSVVGTFLQALIAGEMPRVTAVDADARYLDTVVAAFVADAGRIDRAYHVADTDDPVVVLIRNTTDQWWTMWLYLRDGFVFDMEYVSGIPEL